MCHTSEIALWRIAVPLYSGEAIIVRVDRRNLK